MKKEEFLNLPLDSIRRLIHDNGGITAVFPINGTRRWYQLEYPPDESVPDPIMDYIFTAGKVHVDLCQLFFRLGVDTLVTPIFDEVMLGRNSEYARLAAEGLLYIAEGKEFNQLFDEFDVRVSFYGHYQECFRGTRLEPLEAKFATLTERTRNHNSYRLFFGVCASDEAAVIISETLKFYGKYGTKPNREELIRHFYGEPLKEADIFIGFGKFSIFGIPLLTTSNEDYYFTVSPSMYMTEQQLREIIYDRLFGRPGDNNSYANLSPEDQDLMRQFYRANIGNTLGVGGKQKRGTYWYPLPKVILPEGFDDGF